MIRMDCMKEVERHLPKGVCDAAVKVLEGLEDYFAGATKEDVSFTKLFGSSMFLVEQAEDLGEVRSFEEGPQGRLSLLDAPSQWFDIAEWIGGGDFAFFATIETSDGGPRYLIPRSIAEQVSNVAESIRLKQQQC